MKGKYRFCSSKCLVFEAVEEWERGEGGCSSSISEGEEVLEKINGSKPNMIFYCSWRRPPNHSHDFSPGGRSLPLFYLTGPTNNKNKGKWPCIASNALEDCRSHKECGGRFYQTSLVMTQEVTYTEYPPHQSTLKVLCSLPYTRNLHLYVQFDPYTL